MLVHLAGQHPDATITHRPSNPRESAKLSATATMNQLLGDQCDLFAIPA